MKRQTIIRLLLSGIIIYFVYKETGIATTIFTVLMTIYIELQAKIQSYQKMFNDSVNEYIEKSDDNKESTTHEINDKGLNQVFTKSKFQQRLDELKKAQENKTKL